MKRLTMLCDANASTILTDHFLHLSDVILYVPVIACPSIEIPPKTVGVRMDL